MSLAPVAAALSRVRKVLEHTPSVGRGPDSVARVKWVEGLRFVSAHENGTQIPSDMPQQVGGAGDEVTPGWLFRAGLAACTATTVAMRAAEAGLELTLLEVDLGTQSDFGAFFSMSDGQGQPVYAGFTDIVMTVRIGARGADPDALRARVAEWVACSPSHQTVENATPIAVPIRVEVA